MQTPFTPESLHPLTRLTAWLVTALALPALDAPILAVGVMLLALIGILEPSLARAWWRSRWLFASLLIVYIGVNPETLRWGFNANGIVSATEQIARLAIMVGMLAALFPQRSVDQLIYALYLLLKPFARIGVSAERIALRIALTMQFALQGQPRDLLSRLEAPHSIGPVTVELRTVPLRVTDYVVGIVITSFVIGFYA